MNPDRDATSLRLGSIDLPEDVQGLFWDVSPTDLDGTEHHDFIAERVLASGSWEAISWLRSQLGDEALRDLIRRTRGRLLSRPQLRFWQLILDLPDTEVDAWLALPQRQIWDRRTR